ncbi:MAG: hypothetical protein WC558_03575 [Patulibacter sp.]
MLHHRLLPLLIVGAACVPLAACGGDDEPNASATQPGVATGTTPAAPADGTTTPTTEAPSAGDDAKQDGSTPDAPAADGTKADGAGADDSATKPKSQKSDSGAKPSSKGSGSSDSSSGGSKAKKPAAPEVPKVLKDYAKGGAPATADEAESVRASMLGFQEALVAQDAGKACDYTLGLPAKSDPSKPAPSCETLIEGSKMAPPTDQDREMIQKAKIVVNGDRASIELGGSGVPMPFRNVDGRWRIDYGTLLGLGGSAG